MAGERPPVNRADRLIRDLRRFDADDEDETRGAPPFGPAEMVCLLLYAYGVGVDSRRQIARACERNLAFLASARSSG